jgi:hypothetical protein
MTPPSLARTIVDYYRPSGTVLDPARGAGAFYDALLELEPSPESVDWCEVREGRDFLDPYARLGPCDWIVTNPPWSQIRPFLARSMQLANDIVFLATLPHFLTRARLREISEAGFGLREALLVTHPPAPWPGSGFQLAAVRIQRGYAGRLGFTDAQTVDHPSPLLCRTSLVPCLI